MWEAIIAGSASIAGGLIANRQKEVESSRNRDFQERMSGSAHQREVTDLRAAGLNPILSGVGGVGAATSAGSMAAQEDVITPAVSTALDAHRNSAEVANMKQQLENLKQEENTSASLESAQDIAAHKTSLEAKKVIEETRKIVAETSTAKSVSGISSNELFSSNIEQRLDALKTEMLRRGVSRYGATAKELLPWGKSQPQRGRKK